MHDGSSGKIMYAFVTFCDPKHCFHNSNSTCFVMCIFITPQNMCKRHTKLQVVHKKKKCLISLLTKFDKIHPQSVRSKDKLTLWINYANDMEGDVSLSGGQVTQSGQGNTMKGGHVTLRGGKVTLHGQSSTMRGGKVTLKVGNVRQEPNLTLALALIRFLKCCPPHELP